MGSPTRPAAERPAEKRETAAAERTTAGGVPIADETPAAGVVIPAGMLGELRSASAALDQARQAALDHQLELDYLTMRIRRAFALKPGDVIDLATGKVARAPSA